LRRFTGCIGGGGEVVGGHHGTGRVTRPDRGDRVLERSDPGRNGSPVPVCKYLFLLNM